MWLQTVTANVEYVRKNVGLATNKMSIDGTCYFFYKNVFCKEIRMTLFGYLMKVCAFIFNFK